MYKFFKRLTDIIIAGIALIVLLPLFIPVIIILLLTGEHEIFYLQKRVGYKNRLFNIIKFATMLKDSPNIGTGIITLRNDPRVTPFGRFLRMSKINELPQVINVLRGDMSIVGPRPLVQKSVDLYPDGIREHVYNVKPGMTGLGSIVFRDEEKIISAGDPEEIYKKVYRHKGALEIWYQQHASMWTDIKVIFVTAWLIIFPGSKLKEKAFKGLPPGDF